MAVWTVTKKTFKEFYDNLFLLVIINLVWFTIASVTIFIGYTGVLSGWFVPLIVPLIALGPFVLSGLHIAEKVASKNEFKFVEIFTGIKNYFVRGLAGFLFTILVYLILFVDLYFFLSKGSDSTLFLILAVVVFYIVIFFSMMQLYFWGLLTIQEDASFKLIIKRSFLLTVDNIVFSFLWLIIVAILSIILTATGIGLAILFIELVGLMVINGTRNILKKYDNVEEGERDE